MKFSQLCVVLLIIGSTYIVEGAQDKKFMTCVAKKCGTLLSKCQENKACDLTMKSCEMFTDDIDCKCLKPATTQLGKCLYNCITDKKTYIAPNCNAPKKRPACDDLFQLCYYDGNCLNTLQFCEGFSNPLDCMCEYTLTQRYAFCLATKTGFDFSLNPLCVTLVQEAANYGWTANNNIFVEAAKNFDKIPHRTLEAVDSQHSQEGDNLLGFFNNDSEILIYGFVVTILPMLFI